MMKRNYLFVITGPSGCGKTTLLKKLELSYYNQWNKRYWEKADKHSTRLPRVGERDCAGYSDVNTPNILSSDSYDEILEKKERKRNEIIEDCNIIYYMNGELYGFDTSKILRQLEKTHVAIVLSDLGVIKQLKENPSYELTDRIVTLYISSCVNKNELTDVWLSRYRDFQGNKKDENDFISRDTISHKDIDALLEELEKRMSDLSQVSLANTSEGYERFKDFYFKLEKLVEIQETLVPDNESYSVRVDRLKNFYFKYIIDIGLFDYVILNYFDERKDDPIDEKMSLQAKNIIDYIEETNNKREEKGQSYLSYNAKLRPQDAVFFVCAAPRSGKNILMKNLHIMSEKQIYVVRKQGLREKKDSDGQDKMMPLIERRDGETDDEFTIRRREIEKFIDKANREYNSYMSEVNDLEKEIENLNCEADEKEYIILGKRAKLKRIESQFSGTRERLLSEAQDFFDSEFRQWNWRFHETYYGIDLPTIRMYGKKEREKIEEPVIPVIMISNMDELEKAQELLGDRLVPIFLTYVATDESNHEYHMGLVGRNGGYKDKDEASKKLNEINYVRNQYYKNIGKFRHVLLNSGIEEDMHDQIINIVRLYGGTNGKS